MMKRLSPVLVLDAIEPALPFYRDRLGFEVHVTVPLREGAPELGFVILQRDAVEIMLQTRASVAGDVPSLAAEPNRATLYVEVADIAAIEEALAGCEIVVPRRRTFYGADEVGVRAPGGHVLLFAQMSTP
jgi:uncharacterized glyoxalase superfamily protein PhnB